MAIIKKELNAEEIKKLSEEELKEVDGGLITVKDYLSFNADGKLNYLILYHIYDDNGKPLGLAESLDAAIEVCKVHGCSTEIVDEREYWK